MGLAGWLVLQGFPDKSWPVQLYLLDESRVYHWWTWSVFAVTSAMIGLGVRCARVRFGVCPRPPVFRSLNSKSAS